MDRQSGTRPDEDTQPVGAADPVGGIDQIVQAERRVDTSARPLTMSLPRLRAVTTVMAIMAGLGSVSISLYAPSLPALAADLKTRVELAELTLTLFLAGFACAQLLYGPLSDRFGRRPILLGGTVIYVLGSLACWIAPTIGTLIAARFVQALGACVGQSVGRAVVRDLYDRDRLVSVLAVFSAAIASASSLGPSIGGFVEVYLGWRANFVILTALGLLLLGALLLILPETNRRREPTLQPARMLRNYGLILCNRRFLGYMIVGSGIFAGYYSFIAAAPFLFIDGLGIPPDHYGMIAILPTLTYVCSALAASRAGRVLPINRTILFGLCVAALGCAGLLGPALLGSFGLLQMLVGMMVFAVGMGFVFAASVAGALVPFPTLAGSASALIGFVQMVTGALATLAVGHFHAPSALPLSLVMGGLVVLAAAGYVLVLSSGPLRAQERTANG